ncbi:MAG: HAD family phosphatase [candidate division NC10 bacterium]|nr:HAD family phosphatase [candidate division NC10 bacterium]
MPQALIFDMDGVIVDSEPLHLLATQRALQLIGRDLSEEEYYRRYVALTDRELFEALLGKGDPQVEPLMVEKQRLYQELAASGVRPYPATVAFIKRAQEVLPLAIATGATREEAEEALQRLGIRDAFRIVVSAEDYERGKPDPAPYLLAAHRLGVLPSRCVVIEDSKEGVRAAKAAGMVCLALTHTHAKAELAHADLVLETLDGLDPKALFIRFDPGDF